MKDKMMKTKRNEIFVGLNRNWIYSKASKMRRLRYLFCIFLTLSLLTDLAYSFSEYGTCRFFITGFKGDANGFRTGRRTISWRYQGKVVGAGNTLNFMDETNGGEKDTYAYNKEYGDILLLELIDGKATKSFAVNLTKTSSKNPSTPYLQFEKRSILDKGVKKNIMVVHIMMVQTLNEGTEPLPVTYKIDGGSCEITYKNEDKTIHERIDVIANEPPTHGNNPKFNDYIIPKYVPLPTDAKTEFIMPQKPNGVCFFDVDGTLSQNDENTNDVVVKNCLDKDFSVGIITSSQRTIDYLCEEYFISENLCKLIKNNNMFNSLVMRSGKKYTVPKFEEFLNPERKKKPDANFKLGNLKALHAHNWRYVNYKDMPDKCVLLIDDDVETLYGYLFYG
ncbi:MAG TPA: hypothetical protein VKR58_03975, partial [Aquella sp.]|nr:hypothetical protein [Aquella sp.]